MAISELRKMASELHEAGHVEIADKLFCALAALNKTVKPLPEQGYSAMMRYLRKEAPDKVKDFQIAFKKVFDEAVMAKEENADKLALLSAAEKIGV